MARGQFHLGIVTDFFLNAVFPRFCLACGKEGDIVCSKCAGDFHDVLTWDGSEHFASFAYGNALVHDLIKAWKYEYDQSAFQYLKRFAESTMHDVRRMIEREHVEAIAYVPLSPRRERERGFNQAKMIAEWIGKVVDLPVIDILERREASGHQAERTDEERRAAMKESPFSFHGDRVRSIMIVDDVWTTGATLQAALQTLKSGGAERVIFYTLAKGR